MFTELEYKYKADKIDYPEFRKLMESLHILKTMEVTSPDVYYTKGEEFLRYRQGNKPELTKKVKNKQTNNWDRVEVDLPLDFHRTTKAIVTKFSELLGYKEDFTIHKSCFIFYLADVNYVYYIVFDENFKERGRFIEVEVNKDKIKDHNGAEEILKDAAEKLRSIGLTPQNRLKHSLFEMYHNPSL